MAQPLAFVRKLTRQNFSAAKKLYPGLSKQQLSILRDLTTTFHLSVAGRDVLCIDGNWYVSHPGLLRIANRRRCFGIMTEVVQEMTEASERRWVFKATVRKSQSKSFVGYGDADPSNVSAVVRGAEMRVAETRAVNRALRKAYGIGICSVEELGSSPESRPSPPQAKELSLQRTNGKFATASASSSACTNSMPLWSSPTPSISAAPRPSAKPPASR